MRKDYEKLFTHRTPPKPPEGLFAHIMERIREEERFLSFKKRFILFSAVLLASVGAFVPVILAFKTTFAQSGFPQFLSLIFSDFGLVIANWQDFSLALLESLPAMSVIAFLATLYIFFWGFKHLTQAVKSFSFPHQFLNN